MSLYLFDFGKFQHFSHALDRKRIYQTNIPVPDTHSCSGFNSKDDLDEQSPCHGNRHKSKYSSRQMSVPQMPLNPSIIKVAREQRVASVVGMPHRHHITIAVNDEPVDIIKTTCTGPCHDNATHLAATTCHQHQNNVFADTDPASKHNSTNIIILTLIYVLSTICVRSVINLYTSLFGTTSFQRKLTLSLLYFFAALGILVFSLNPCPGHIGTWSSRIRLLLSLLLLILWSGLHLLPSMPLFSTVIVAAILGGALSLFWDCQMQLLVKWSHEPLASAHVDTINDVRIRSNIVPTTNVISHSMHIWSNILLFIVLEAMTTTMFLGKKPTKVEVVKKYHSNRSSFGITENVTDVCGIIGVEYPINQRWKKANPIMTYLLYVCISLNVIALILVILLFDKSRSIRIPSNSIHKDTYQSDRSKNAYQNSSLLESNEDNEVLPMKFGSQIFWWAKNKSIVIMKIWQFQTIKFSFPSLLTMGLAEGFFITDYNERFVNCFHKPSYVGISMLTFALGVVLFVNILQILKRHQTIEVIAFPVSRVILGLCSLILVLTNVGHHWSFLLIFYPIVMSSDAMICLAVYYVKVANLPGHLTDNSIALQRLLRLLGIAIYILISGLAGAFTASVMTIVAHCLVSPAIISVSRLIKESQNLRKDRK